jgi:hypothetical protein
MLLCGCGAASGLIKRLVPCPSATEAPQVLYPIDDASGVPDGNFTLIVAYPVNPSSLWAPPTFVASGGTQVSGGGYVAAPSPLPSPMATPGIPESTMYGVAVPALQSKTTYSVVLNANLNIASCASAITVGSFSTQ